MKIGDFIIEKSTDTSYLTIHADPEEWDFCWAVDFKGFAKAGINKDNLFEKREVIYNHIHRVEFNNYMPTGKTDVEFAIKIKLIQAYFDAEHVGRGRNKSDYYLFFHLTESFSDLFGKAVLDVLKALPEEFENEDEDEFC